MDVDVPSPPEAVKQLRALEERWEQLIDWVHHEYGVAYRYRAHMCYRVMMLRDVNRRWFVLRFIEQKMRARLRYIDEVEAEFRAAYDLVRRDINSKELLAHAVLVLPIVKERDALLRKQLHEKRMAAASRHAERISNKERKAGRPRRIDDEGRNRDISQTDRAQEALDEGTRS